MKLIIACDSFKGCLGSAEVNEACRLGVADACPDCVVDTIVLADGGEGTVDALAANMPGGIRHCATVCGPLSEPVAASYYALPASRTAIIETASAAGLTLVPPTKRNPMLTSTYGLGQLIADAVGRGYRNIIVGLGGSATNDGGTGMLQALGYRFVDGDGKDIGDRGGQILSRIARVDTTGRLPRLDSVKFTALCDVVNPLLGPRGATYVYGPQKGADKTMLDVLEEGMNNFARIIPQKIVETPGAGAAGGLGAAMMAFLEAQLRPGIDTILDLSDFDRRLGGASLVITGEGRLDASTLMGKAPSGVLRRAAAHNVPVIAIGGSVDNSVDFSAFKAVKSINPPNLPLATAIMPEVAAHNIRSTIAAYLSAGRHRHS